jgi:hypothetical protein
MADLLPQRHNDLGQPSIDLIERTSKRCKLRCWSSFVAAPWRSMKQCGRCAIPQLFIRLQTT